MENEIAKIMMALLFGWIAAGVMSLLLFAINKTGSLKSYLVKGIGSSIPTPQGGSMVPGFFIFLVTGAVTGLVYMLVGQEFRWFSPAGLLLFGAGLGLGRGLVTNGLLWMVAFDQAPKAHIVQAGGGVAAAHILGQVVYGLSLSALFGLSRIVDNLAF